ncbi:unnamed protein product [Adineta steineri]|uniref:NADP-dependent oxidoreductase domain-containing protein n=1 Tax=Adineta steineri TaxID=433720 RepID=A0A815HQP2_9BILA|nr:unnamed protein product [Adineta steineri]
MTRTTPLLITALASGVSSSTTSIFFSPILINKIKIHSSLFFSSLDKTPKELMEYRDLGRTDLKVSLLSSGAWVTFGEQLDINEAYNCIKFAYDNVCNFFDNAEVYSFGKPETAMDEVLKRMFKQDGIQRTNLVILTKIFWDTSCYHPQAIKANLKGLSRKRIVEDNMLHRIRFEVEYDNLYKPPISYGTTIWSPLASGLVTGRW